MHNKVTIMPQPSRAHWLHCLFPPLFALAAPAVFFSLPQGAWAAARTLERNTVFLPFKVSTALPSAAEDDGAAAA